MAQLLVREIEPAVVRELRSRAAAQGISVEEAHRRLLRSALMEGKPGPEQDFVAYLQTIPKTDSVEFVRERDLPREIDLPPPVSDHKHLPD